MCKFFNAFVRHVGGQVLQIRIHLATSQKLIKTILQENHSIKIGQDRSGPFVLKRPKNIVYLFPLRWAVQRACTVYS